jgi:hypothetical protein
MLALLLTPGLEFSIINSSRTWTQDQQFSFTTTPKYTHKQENAYTHTFPKLTLKNGCGQFWYDENLKIIELSLFGRQDILNKISLWTWCILSNIYPTFINSKSIGSFKFGRMLPHV